MHFIHTRHGFSLIEIMIALVVSSILTAGIYEIFHTQQNTHRAQDEVVKMQQNMRGGLYLLARDLRSAGFDPNDSNAFGFVVNMPKVGGGNLFPTDIDYTIDTNRIALSLDNNGNGAVDDNNNERIAYRLNNTILERYNSNAPDPTQMWEPIIDNVDALDFVYLDANGNVLATNDPAQIRAVQVSLLVRTGKVDRRYTNNTTVYLNKQGQNICPTCQNDHHRRRLMTSTIHIRNL